MAPLIRTIPRHGIYAQSLRMRPPTFSTRALNRSPNTNQKVNDNGQPEIPRFSLEGLGLSRNVRIALYTILGVWGTFETYFYYRAIMRWWKSGKEEVESVD